MGVRQNIPGCCPDEGHGTSGRTIVQQIFSEKFEEKSFLYKNLVRTGWHIVRMVTRPQQAISISGFRASGRLNFNTQFPYLMCVRPSHEGQTSGRLKSNRQLPYTMHQRPDHSYQTSGRSILNCDSCLMETRVRTGYHIVRTVHWSSLSWNLERINEPFENWKASERAAETSGRSKVEQKLLDTV
jgi:hypothetical protein